MEYVFFHKTDRIFGSLCQLRKTDSPSSPWMLKPEARLVFFCRSLTKICWNPQNYEEQDDRGLIQFTKKVLKV
jgi:hypothetical protein